MVIETLFRPQIMPALGQVNINLKIWKEGNDFEDLQFTLPSYYTTDDIKREYFTLAPDASRLPRFVFMGVKKGEQFLQSINYNFFDNKKDIIYLQYPTKTVLVRPDNRWITSEGEPLEYEFNQTGKILIEDFFEYEIKQALEEGIEEPTIVIYVYELTRLIRAYKGLRPISSRDWYSRFAPFFPGVPPNGEPTQDDVNESQFIMTIATKRTEMVNKINEILSYEFPVHPIAFRGAMRIKLMWNPVPDFKGCEMFFYETDVNHNRPFIRLMRPSGQPVNKLFTQGQIPIPDIADPELLRQWARETSPTPKKEFLFTKNLVREQKEGLRAIYSTLRVYNEGSADYVIVPPKKERVLQANMDLADFNEQIERTLQGTLYTINSMKLGDASLIFTLTMPVEEPKITAASLSKKMPCFSPFFQLIKPYVADMPKIMLRYKMVSNFSKIADESEKEEKKETQMASYITYLSERQTARSENVIPAQWVPKIATEFQISLDEANKAVQNWLLNRSSFTIVTEEDIYEGKHPGIDIAVYEQHPQYNFHIYGVNKTNHLLRIVTLLQLLFSVHEDEFGCSGPTVEAVQQEVQKAETALQEISEKKPVVGSLAAMDDDLMFDDLIDDTNVANAPAAISAAADVQAAALAQQNAMMLKEQYKTAVGAPSAVGAKPSNATAAADEIVETVTGKDAPVLKEFFINLLKSKDPALFNYELVGKQNPYSRKCAANVFAQPLVLTYEQFMKNYNTYINDPDVIFTVYPYTKHPMIPDGAEEYTFLRYGSDAKKDLFYTCPLVYCIRDSMIIRPKDFESDKDRQGRPKPKNSCPFCYGLRIVNSAVGTPNYTVVVRTDKAGTGYTPLKYVGFMSKTDHPQGFYFPCCYVSRPDKYSLLDSPAFEKQRDWLKKGIFQRIDGEGVSAAAAAIAAPEDEDSEDEYESYVGNAQTVSTTMLEHKMKPYLILFSSIHLEYIQNPEKILIQGTLGMVPSAIEAYFGQDNKQLAKSTKGRQSILPNSEGFLRVGVGNLPKYKADSLLLAIAPILGRNTLTEVKMFLLEKISPYFFIQLNYGNLVHEFFNPSYPLPKGGEEEVMQWCALYLKMDPHSENRAAAIRFWKAYHRFREHVISENETKELRVFGPILSYAMLTPNTANGCLLLVIEHDVNNPDKPVQVLCPAYGVTPQAKDIADIAFISKTKQGFYEPLIYTKNRAATGTAYAQHLYTLKWQRAEQVSWPPVVKQRISEFIHKCEGPGRSIYASEPIDQYAIIGMNALYQVAIRKFPNLIRGVLRESYNHVVALLFSPTQDSQQYVAVPCVDDGFLITHPFNIVLDWNGYVPAPLDDCIEFYSKYIEPNFSLYKGYKIIRGLKPDGAPISVARLENGLKFPCASPRGKVSIPIQSGKIELQWMQDKIIAESNDLLPKPDMNINIINELYEYFRLSFSEWLVAEEQTETRRSITSILANGSLENWEKWKRLDILLRSTLTRWLDTEEYTNYPEFSMLRKSCVHIIDSNECTGVCKWRGTNKPEGVVEEEEKEGEQSTKFGKCLIHTPKSFKKDQTTDLSVPELFIFRLFDELIRFRQKRDELFENKVSRLKIPTEAKLVDGQWILPESSPAWIELLRLEWARDITEKPRFYEEMSASPEERELYLKSRTNDFLTSLAPELINFLGAGAESLLQWSPPLTDETAKQPYLPLISIIGSAYDAGLSVEAKEITEDVLKRLAEQKNRSIIVINPTTNKFIIGRPHGYTIRDINKGFFLIIESDGKLPSLIIASKATAVLQEDQLPTMVRNENRKRTPRVLLRK
jgi:hypothetical protein